MGKHFALTFQLPAYTKQRQVRTARNGIAGIQAVHVGAAVLVLLVGTVLAYLVQVNNFATKGYEINRLQTQLAQLQDEHDKLQVQAAQLQSIQRIQTDPAVLNMVPINQITYVQTTALTQR